MMFLFAYLGQFQSPKGWPIELMHTAEMVLVAAAVVSLMLACLVRNIATSAVREIASFFVAIIGGISASLALLMPVELAPFFFGVRGEWMMATMGLILFYPVAAVLFFLLLYKITTSRMKPPPLPAA